MFTVRQLSRMAGITPRTLHYYDEIGLLKPSEVGENGYRYYGEESLLRLQQILLYRQMDMPLKEIQKIMGRRDFDVADILAAMPEGPAALEAQACIERWRQHIEYFWVPNEDQLVGLAELYNQDPRFKASFDKVDPKLAEFMLEAVKIYVNRR